MCSNMSMREQEQRLNQQMSESVFRNSIQQDDQNRADPDERLVSEKSSSSGSEEGDDPMPFVVDDPPSTFHFIIHNDDATQILVKKPDDSGPFLGQHQLPFLSPPTDDSDIMPIHSWNSQTADLCSAIFHFLGLRLYLRDLLWRDPNLSFGREENILVANLLEPSSSLFDTFFWAPLEQVKKLHWKTIRTEVDIPALVAQVLSVSSATPDLLPPHTKENLYSEPPQPWRRPGWFRDVHKWFKNITTKESIPLHPDGRLSQLQNQEYSTVFMCPLDCATTTELSTLIWSRRSSNHHVFLKSSCPSIPEARLTKTVASHLPQFVPNVVAVRDENTFLQDGIGADYYSDPCVMLQALLQMQHRSLECLEALQKDGIPYHGLDWHAKQLTKMLKTPVLKSVSNEETYAKVLARVEDLQTIFAELAAYKIPQTLIHGDYIPENIVGVPDQQGVLRFVDWSNAAVGHPFVDFVRFYFFDDWGSDDERESAKSQYLRSWEQFETEENIRRVVDLAHVVMLCENLHVLLKFFICAGRFGRENFLNIFKDRLDSILYYLMKQCHRSPLEDPKGSDAVSRLIICKDNGRMILAKQGSEALSLPFMNAFGISGHAVTDRQVDGHGMRIIIRSQLGIDTRRTRSFWLHPESEADRIRCAQVFEALNMNNQTPSGYEWVDSRSVESFGDCRGRERNIVEAFFRNSSDDCVAPTHIPWRSFGWLHSACDWADNALLKYGLERQGDLHEVKSDALGTVWKGAVKMASGKRAHSLLNDTDSVFLKASIMNESEGEVLSVISLFAEEAVPSVIGTSPDLKAFLVTGIGTADLDKMDWRFLFQGLGRLQVGSIPHVDMLVKAGLRIYDCGWVASNADALLKRCRYCTSQAEDKKLSITGNDIVQCMAELEQAKLPLTLVHGDFHSGNIGRKTTQGYGIFDWGSSFVGIPLCDVAVMTRVENDDFVEEDAALEGYRSVWQAKIGDIDLSRVMDLSLVYYWVLNLSSVDDLVKKAAVVNKASVKNLAAENIRRLELAIQRVHATKDQKPGYAQLSA